MSIFIKLYLVPDCSLLIHELTWHFFQSNIDPNSYISQLLEHILEGLKIFRVILSFQFIGVSSRFSYGMDTMLHYTRRKGLFWLVGWFVWAFVGFFVCFFVWFWGLFLVFYLFFVFFFNQLLFTKKDITFNLKKFL